MNTVSKRTAVYTIECLSSNYELAMPIKMHCQSTHSRLSQNLMKCQFPWVGPSLGDLACFRGPKSLMQEILKIKEPTKKFKKLKILVFDILTKILTFFSSGERKNTRSGRSIYLQSRHSVSSSFFFTLLRVTRVIYLRASLSCTSTQW